MWRGENLEYDMGGWKEEKEVDESCGVRVILVGGRGILQSCCLHILCFDGLAFIFMAVFLCCGEAVLKSSIFS